jgi:hypothetical protein
VRIDCSLCGVKMLDLDLCLSASVDVRYILHTQPLGLYNKDFVWESIYPSVFISIYPCGITLLTLYTFRYRCMLSFHLLQTFLFLSHPPLLFIWQKMESATPVTIATTTPGSHHVSSSCWPCILSFWRPWCNDSMSIK